jgi:hypothetical protein
MEVRMNSQTKRRTYEIEIDRDCRNIGHFHTIPRRIATVVGERQTSDEEWAVYDGQGSKGADCHGQNAQGSPETCAILQPTGRTV